MINLIAESFFSDQNLKCEFYRLAKDIELGATCICVLQWFSMVVFFAGLKT